jgi:hypothetical protein
MKGFYCRENHRLGATADFSKIKRAWNNFFALFRRRIVFHIRKERTSPVLDLEAQILETVEENPAVSS